MTIFVLFGSMLILLMSSMPIGIALGFATVLAVPAIVGLIVLFAAARRAGA